MPPGLPPGSPEARPRPATTTWSWKGPLKAPGSPQFYSEGGREGREAQRGEVAVPRWHSKSRSGCCWNLGQCWPPT